ncbi:hypothetical protein [Mediterraneibacter sp. ICN-202921]|uniref:hypothetical protein n=1 Tax=Mediterraneibacter sp. ICN-202921 TaxID=3134657 RepID=UPI0030BDD008
MEDKQKICDLLLPALQATRAFYDLDDLEYIPEQGIVIATFADGTIRKVDVWLKEGDQVIIETIKQLKTEIGGVYEK